MKPKTIVKQIKYYDIKDLIIGLGMGLFFSYHYKVGILLVILMFIIAGLEDYRSKT